MTVFKGTHQLGPQDGRLWLKTSRTGLGRKAGHDLTIAGSGPGDDRGLRNRASALAVRPAAGGGLVAVRLVRNTGASFGIGTGHPVAVVLVSAVIIAVVAVLLARTPSRPAALFLAAVLGGALGNLADRLFRSPGLGRGAVIDWIHVGWYPATFNLADVAIRVGAVAATAAMLGVRVHPGRW